MKYTLEIQKLLFEAEDNKTLTPKDKVRLFKQAARIADANDDVEWGYEIRLQLIRECYFLAGGADLVHEFSWLLNAYEAHPDWFDENDFLWQYQWVLGEMYSNPEVSMGQIRAILDDFKARLERNGYGLRPYYDRLYEESLTLRQFEKAKTYLDLRNAAPDDAMGSCPACMLDNELDYYLLTGRFDEACQRARPLLSKQLVCTHVPARTFCVFTYYADKNGRTELAAELCDRAEAELALLLNDENLATPTSMLINYMLAHRPEKAWVYFEKSLPWYLEDNAYSRYDYACYVLEGLLRLDGSDSAVLNLPSEFELYMPQHRYSVSALTAYFRQEARRQAAAFDARNGCSAFAERIEALSE